MYNYAENEPVGHIDLWGLQKEVFLISGQGGGVIKDKAVIDALWQTYHSATGDNGINWIYGQNSYNSLGGSRKNGSAGQPIYNGTLFMELTEKGVNLAFVLPSMFAEKERNGISVMTGVGSLGSFEDPSGTSEHIIDDFPVAFGGGAGTFGKGGVRILSKFFDDLTNLISTLGNVNPDRSIEALLEKRRRSKRIDQGGEPVDTVCINCGYSNDLPHYNLSGVTRDKDGNPIDTIKLKKEKNE